METRFCAGCNQEKPLTDFYKSSRDGFQARCKECKRVEGRERNRQPKRKAYNARFQKELTESGYFQEYQSRPEVKRRRADRAKQYSQDPKLRIRWLARWYSRRMVRNGSITQQPCAICGKEDSQMHHPDYTKPLLIVWLCADCHRKLHRNAKAEGRKE